MKTDKKRWIVFALCLFAALLMILTGLLSTLSAYRSYRDKVIEYQNRHLLSITASVTRSIKAYADHYTNSISEFVQRSNVASAEIRFLAGVDSSDLTDRMRFHLDRLQDTAALLSMQGSNGERIGTGSVYCSCTQTEHPANCVTTHLTASQNGAIYLSFCYARGSGTTYSLHIPVFELFKKVSADVVADGCLFLTSRQSELFLAASRSEIRNGTVSELQQRYPGLSLDHLRQAEDTQNVSTVIEDIQIPGLGSSYLFNCATLPLTDDTLIIGTAMDRAQVIAAMRSASVQLWLSCVLLALGVLLMLFVTIRTKQSNQQAVHEIELLRERSRLLEEINTREQKNFHAQRLQEVGTMAAGIVHEFNNLLTPIMGYTVMTLDTLPEENTEGYDNLLEVYQASKKAKEVVRQIGQMSRKNADLTYTALEPDALVHQTLSMAALAARGPVSLREELNCPGVLIRGSRTMLHQTILNLCINACQSMGTQGGALTVCTQMVRQDHTPFVELRVKDTGPGIDPAIMDRIFEPFFTTKEAGVGTGLGLAIGRHVIEVHGGSIRACNEPGSGACFVVLLPVLPEQENPS